MLHRSQVEWPCLSLDVLMKDRFDFPNNCKSWFPSQLNGNLNPDDTVYNDKLQMKVHK